MRRRWPRWLAGTLVVLGVLAAAGWAARRDFPAYHAHPNRAGLWSEAPDAVPARQTLYLGDGRVGWLDLPVVD